MNSTKNKLPQSDQRSYATNKKTRNPRSDLGEDVFTETEVGLAVSAAIDLPLKVHHK